ncbi:MAG: hypothetical protein COV97_04750 [Zetaproteobacteria bacterium CG11_big_fil_rev_8_21_14_0_20_59_439]|nr:MAG: hypothetical protein COV97_04750 [Zetaproteobacteria bacterium CG11_big_fil_rev_8_21_14_0_20_59_439]
MTSVLKDRPLLFHHLEWILMHPRFGILMLLLIAMSFTHNQMLATILFVVFCIELSMRVAIMRYKIRTNPYRSSLNSKLDALFLVLDFIGIASLLITVLNIPLDAESAAVARLLRAFYLMRTLRAFRYIDLQSTMYSPTYGMFISLVILLSFFAQDTILWVVIIFFSVELAVRALIMRHMEFETKKERLSEWGYWWVDLVATVVMIPALAVVPHGSALRALRLIRLLRPWSIILRNLRDVIREGQFMQEVNLIVLLLGVLAIAGGVAGHFMLPPFDYTQDGVIGDIDSTLFAQIWFSFRLFTDPGNAILYPPSTSMAVVSVVAVITGVFIFAFFIGIGAQVVSGLMQKLRNERLNVTNHMVMLGWSETAPYIIEKLKNISERHFSRLKLVILGESEHAPAGLAQQRWVSYRWGDMQQVRSLKRVNLGHARQAIINVPDNVPQAIQLSHSMFSLLAIRKVNPNIYLNYASPGLARPQLSSHHHILQIGWDNLQMYNKPTVVMSHADVRANMMRNILIYQDFDQVMERLMIPGRTEESALQISEWSGEVMVESGRAWLGNRDGSVRLDVVHLAARLQTRGVTLVALADENGKSFPLYSLAAHAPFTTRAALALAIQPRDVSGEMAYLFARGEREDMQTEKTGGAMHIAGFAAASRRSKELRLVITGWVGSLPLLLKLLLKDFERIDVRIIDDVTPQEQADNMDYLRRRLGEVDTALGRVTFDVIRWDFTNMNRLRDFVRGADRILLSQPLHLKDKAYLAIITVLAHLITVVREQEIEPKIFPILQNREQARLLQEELDRFELPTEVHVTVPDEFYGTYIAHTSYHMFASENEAAYELQRTLRHTIDGLMGDTGEDDDLDVFTLDVSGELPQDAEAVFSALLDKGYIWIGYRLREGFEWSDPLQTLIRRVFPREQDFTCLRQHQIIINPFGNPVSRHSWLECHADIAELIVICDASKHKDQDLTRAME